jgi:hypothetical protein
VELAQEIVVRLALPAYRTVGVAVVPKMNLHHVQMLEVVAVELWLLVMILQILCLYRGLEVILLLLQEIIGVINLQTLVSTPLLYTRQVAVMCWLLLVEAVVVLYMVTIFLEVVEVADKWFICKTTDWMC